MVTFFSNSKIKIKRNDTVGTYMHEWAWDIYMEEMLCEYGKGELNEEISE